MVLPALKINFELAPNTDYVSAWQQVISAYLFLESCDDAEVVPMERVHQSVQILCEYLGEEDNAKLWKWVATF